MSHPELVLLALLIDGPAHGYELVQRVRSMELERWAKVAESTLYSVLRRLEDRGFVGGKAVPGDRGRTKTVYRVTDEGRERLRELVARGLESPDPLYSDRLVAAVFAVAAGMEERLETAIDRVRESEEDLGLARKRDDISPVGRVVVDFYHRIAAAQLEALETLRDHCAEKGDSTLPDLSNERRTG